MKFGRVQSLVVVGCAGVCAAFLVACGPGAGRAGATGGTGSSTGNPASPSQPGPGDPNNPIDNEGKDGPCAKMDLLFVIDNSGSMQEEQNNLSANLPKFINLVDSFTTSEGAQLDWRVAVTSTGRDVTYSIQFPPPFSYSQAMSENGENGEMLMKNGCGMPRRWLQRGDVGADGVFACDAELGTSGPSLEMPLYAMKLAFSDRVADGVNAGFLRDDALLAVVILTDENDCSREDNNFTISPTSGGDECDAAALKPVADYASFLDTLKLGRGRWSTAVVAGPGPGTCSSSFGDAAEARRLKEFVGLAGQNGVFSSICDGDLTKALSDALSTFQAACEAFPPII